MKNWDKGDIEEKPKAHSKKTLLKFRENQPPRSEAGDIVKGMLEHSRKSKGKSVD